MACTLKTLVEHTDKMLRIADIQDWSGARNGLQVENGGRVRRLVSAVDCHLPVLEEAVRLGADLLVVHHGLFWSDVAPLTGSRYRKVKLALDHGLAVYSVHLPLDLHPRLGNNVLLARAMGLRSKLRPFFHEKGQFIGCRTEVALDRQELVARVARAVGSRPLMIEAGPSRVRKVGIVTGGAGNELARAAAEGVDTFVTGEGSHWTWGAAHDLGINVIYAGHYATETFGVKALGGHLARKFDLTHRFIDMPTGL